MIIILRHEKFMYIECGKRTAHSRMEFHWNKFAVWISL